MAAEEVLLPGVGGFARRRGHGGPGAAARGQHRRLRPAARPHLRRDRRRGAQQAQVPGHGAAAVRCRGRSRVRYRLGDTRPAGRLRATETRAVRRHRHDHRRPRALRRRQRARRADDGSGDDRRAGAERAAGVRRDSGPDAPRRRSRRAGLAAARGCASLRGQLESLLGLDDAGAVRDRLPPAPQGRAVPAAPLVLAQGIRVEVLADEGVVFGGSRSSARPIVANRGESDGVVWTRCRWPASTATPSCAGGRRSTGWRGDAALRGERDVRQARGSRTPYWRPLPNAARYEFDPDAPFGLPFRPTPFRARSTLVIGGAEVVDGPAGRSIATKATSSAARSGRSCRSCRASRCR